MRIGLIRHEARMMSIKNLGWETSKTGNRDTGAVGRIIIKRILIKQEGRVYKKFAWLVLVDIVADPRVPKRCVITWPAQRITASQEFF
jgi:hypothetical protein